MADPEHGFSDDESQSMATALHQFGLEPAYDDFEVVWIMGQFGPQPFIWRMKMHQSQGPMRSTDEAHLWMWSKATH